MKLKRFANIVNRNRLKSDSKNLETLTGRELLYRQTKLLRFIHRIRTDDYCAGVHYFAYVLRRVVVIVTVRYEDYVSIMKLRFDIVGIRAYDLSVVNSNASLFV